MSEELKKALQELADREQRKLSQYVEIVLQRHVDEHPATASETERVAVKRVKKRP